MTFWISRVCNPINLPTPCSSCTTGAPAVKSFRFWIIASASRVRLRLLVCLARLPNNCCSAIIVMPCSVKSTESSAGETSKLIDSLLSINSFQLFCKAGLIFKLRRVSLMYSRLPSDSATNRIFPSFFRINSRNCLAGSSKRESIFIAGTAELE